MCAAALGGTLYRKTDRTRVGGRLLRISGRLNVALSEAIARSHATINAHPKPLAAPWTSASTGISLSCTARYTSRIGSATLRRNCAVVGGRSGGLLGARPPQKLAPLERMRISFRAS